MFLRGPGGRPDTSQGRVGVPEEFGPALPKPAQKRLLSAAQGVEAGKDQGLAGQDVANLVHVFGEPQAIQTRGGPAALGKGLVVGKADGVQLSQLDIVDVSDPKGLEKLGSNLYKIRKGSSATEIPAEDVTVQQGYLEKSNVEIVTEMVNMMEAQRAFEISQKLMTTTDSMESLVINKVGSIS